MAKVLLIDDDRAMRVQIAAALKETEVELRVGATAAEGLAAFHADQPDVVLLDIMLPDASGLEIFSQIRAATAKVPVIFITAGVSSDTAIQAMKLGAFDYLLKPLDLERVREVVRTAIEIRRLMHIPVQLETRPTDVADGDSLVGRSAAMQEVYKAVGRVATQDVTVLVRGESGSGKELVARAIYHHSHRAEGPFLAVNCAALSESLLESELFGHEKGSFTGAATQRIGKFEQCSGGTLFLDEVGDMSPLVQSKVLRVLQEQRFERVGGLQTIQTDVRIIAATNRDLEKMVADGEFREDLYYRLNGFTIKIPPLRERKDDLLPLIEWFIARYSANLRKDVQGVAPEALQLLVDYSWPGNVRQLQNVLRQAILQSTGPLLIAEFFPAEIRGPVEKVAIRASGEPNADFANFIDDRLKAGSRHLHAETIDMIERLLIAQVLRFTDGNQSKAAEILGITRGSLRRKIRLLDISIDRHVSIPELGGDNGYEDD